MFHANEENREDMKKSVSFNFWVKSITLTCGLITGVNLLACLHCEATNMENGKPGFRKYEDVSGYVNITEASGGIGTGITTTDYSQYLLGISTINGYVINSHFITGIGVGLNAYNGGMMAPVYLDIRYNFNERKFTPYVFGDGGVLLNFDDIAAPGLFINPGLGIITKITDKLAINLGTGLFVQRVPTLASFINFKLGIIFRANSGDPCKLPYSRRR
jgi:hypothetical protein